MSANVVRELVVRLGMQVDEKKIDEAEAKIDNVIAKLRGMAVAAASTAAALASWAVHTSDAAGDAAEQIGITTSSLQELQYAAEQSGSSADAMTSGLQMLVKQMAAASGGSKDAQAAFDRLGVKIKNADGTLRSADAVFYDVADAMAKIKSPADRAVSAVDLLSRAAFEMSPLLGKGSEGVRILAQEARDLGGVFDDEFNQQANAATDQITRMRSVFLGMGASIARGVLPRLQKLSDAFVAWWRVSGQGARAGIARVFESLAAAIDIAYKLSRPWLDLVSQIVAVFASLPGPMQTAIATVIGLTLAFGGLRKAIFASGVGLFALVLEDIWVFTKGGKSLIGQFYAWLSDESHLDGFLGAFRSAFRVVTNILSTAINAIYTMVSAVSSIASGDFSGAWGAIKQGVSTQFEITKDSFGNIGNIFSTMAGAAQGAATRSAQNAANYATATTNAIVNVNGASGSPQEIADAIKTKLDEHTQATYYSLNPEPAR